MDSLEIYDHGARWYDPELGRFLQTDPVILDVRNPQAINPYGYVLNNPLNAVDPSGQLPISTWGDVASPKPFLDSDQLTLAPTVSQTLVLDPLAPQRARLSEIEAQLDPLEEERDALSTAINIQKGLVETARKNLYDAVYVRDSAIGRPMDYDRSFEIKTLLRSVITSIGLTGQYDFMGLEAAAAVAFAPAEMAVRMNYGIWVEETNKLSSLQQTKSALTFRIQRLADEKRWLEQYIRVEELRFSQAR